MRLPRAVVLALVLTSALLARISGTVRDASGLPVSGAAVVLINSENALELSATSDAAGSYAFMAAPPGTYSLRISKPAFSAVRRAAVLPVGEQLVIDVELQPGSVTESVEVTSAPPLLQTARGSTAFVVDRDRTVTLPLDGRNFIPLLALLPGVSLPPGQLLPRINGSRPRTSEYIYDGISVLQPEPGLPPFYPVIDAIEEFRVETSSYSAEYGRSNGGVIVVNQKTGGNTLHGTLFTFLRHESLNARNLFASPGPKPLFRRQQYGLVVGGPLRRNRTFFFADWQGTRLNSGVVRTGTVPTAAQRSGAFTQPLFDPATREPFPGNVIPVSRMDPVALAVLRRFPDSAITGANNYRRTARDTTAQDQFDLRLDQHQTPAHRGFARYTHLRDRSTPSAVLAESTAPQLTHADSLSGEHTFVLSPVAVNQLRVGFTRRAVQRLYGSLANYDIVGFQTLGPAGTPSAVTTSVTQFLDQYSFMRGARHSFKAGLDLRLQRLDIEQPVRPGGTFQFTEVFTGSSLASFLLGQVTRYSVDYQLATLSPRAHIAEAFFQDDWRATPRLTLNLGLRYTLNFPSSVAGNRSAVFNLTTQQLDYPRTARSLDKTGFGPRAGLAFRLTDSLALRAGYSLTWIEQSGITTPFTSPLFPFIQNLVQQTPDNILPAFQLSQGPTVAPRTPGPDAGLGQGVFAVQRDNGSGYAQQWNATLQQTYRAGFSTELGYVGSKLTRLGVPDVNLNQLTVEQLRRGGQRRFPRYNTVALYRNNVGHSTYHSLQARLEKRLSRRVSLNANYTFSRLIDDAGAVFDSAALSGPVLNFQAADSFNRRLEKDVSTGNVPHNFSASAVIGLARGWQLALIARAQSGSPLALVQASNLNAFAGFGVQRPNRLADPRLPSPARSTARWFNTAAFTPAPQFTLGNSSRNPVTGPAYRTVDLMLGKTFALREGLRAEFRAEAFNLTNTPPLGNPNTSFGTPAFGSITTALDPRVFELVMKVHF